MTGDLHYTTTVPSGAHIADASRTLQRSAPADLNVLELRHAGHGTRRFDGLVCPAYRTTYLTKPPERFIVGAWQKSLNRRGGQPCPLLRGHNHQASLGIVEHLRDGSGGLTGEVVLRDDRLGDEALQEIECGAMRGLSVGFVPIRQEIIGGINTVFEAELGEISLVITAAYSSAAIRLPKPDPPALAAARAAAADWRLRKLQLEDLMKHWSLRT
ncbi:MAG: HK97 family phage prohead protease [Acidimicrobiaceae bacterium]|nr:HK97 family phage prohead protease [Acidimicrobiaceae bacterium]